MFVKSEVVLFSTLRCIPHATGTGLVLRNSALHFPPNVEGAEFKKNIFHFLDWKSDPLPIAFTTTSLCLCDWPFFFKRLLKSLIFCNYRHLHIFISSLWYRHAIPPKFSEKWGMECFNTRFLLPTLLCAR